MGRKLSTKTNVDPAVAPYSFGRIRNNPGDGSGTPFNELLYGDIHQLIEKMFENSGLTWNGLPDNDTNGYQLYEALRQNIAKYEGFTLYVGNQTMVAADLGRIVTTYNLFGPGTLLLPTANAAAVGKKVKIFNAYLYDTIINVQGGDSFTYAGNSFSLIGPGTATLKRLDYAEAVCTAVGYWNITCVIRRSNSDLLHKIIEIGDWDMSTTGTKTVAHGLTLSKIRKISASINIDNSTAVYPLTGFVNTTPGGSAYADATNINLFRFTDAQAAFSGALSAFQNINFSNTPFNRGWIIIEFEP